jgi:lactoylglutathione lyase
MPASTDIKLSNLSYVIIYVKDAQKALPFYKDILGMKVKNDDDNWIELETGATTLALHGNEELKTIARDGQPVLVFSVEDIHGTYKALQAKGIKFNNEPHTVCEAGPEQVGMSADFRDPEGNLLSIFGMVKK